MKKRVCERLMLILCCLLLCSSAAGETLSYDPLGTWSSREVVMDGETYITVESTFTFYENGTYNAILFQMIPLSGSWSLEDDIILTDDATMVFEDEKTLIVYYGEYEFHCTRKEETEGGGVTPEEAAEAAASLLAGCYDRIDTVFGRAIRALEAVRQFTSDRQYASLLSARRLCAEVMELTDEPVLPENRLEQMNQAALTELGIDAGNIGILTGMCTGAEGDARKTVSVWIEYLFSEYCYPDLGNAMDSMAKTSETYFRSIAKMQPLLARMILEPLWEEPVMDRLWVSIPEKWPVIGEELPKETDIETVQRLFLELNDLSGQSYEINVELYDSYISAVQERAEWITNGNDDKLMTGFSLPDAMPSAILPLPDAWLDPERIRTKQDGSGSGEMILSISGIEEKEYTDFMKYLLPLISGASLEESGRGGWRCSVREALFEFQSDWNPETQTAGFRYDPSRLTFESAGISSILLKLADAANP